MRTITERLSDRLKIQAQEADLIGFKKMAGQLNRLAKATTRTDDSSYVYSELDLQNDVESPLWDVILRIADYYNCSIDAEKVQENIEKVAEDLIKMVSVQAGIKHGVGAFEPSVLGEVTERVLIEVNDND